MKQMLLILSFLCCSLLHWFLCCVFIQHLRTMSVTYVMFQSLLQLWPTREEEKLWLLGRPQVDHKKNLVSMTNLMVTLRPLFSLHKNVFALVVCVHYIGWHLAQLVLKLWQQQVQELLRY
jgi:hypothetical protein